MTIDEEHILADIAGLVLPFFGLIFIGYLTARLRPMPPRRWAG